MVTFSRVYDNLSFLRDSVKSLSGDSLTALRTELEDHKRQTDVQLNEIEHILCELTNVVQDVVTKIK